MCKVRKQEERSEQDAQIKAESEGGESVIALQSSKEIIKQSMSRHEVLAQLAEECAELGQAALKLRRTLNPDASPTTVSEDDAEQSFREEIADVLLCIGIATDDDVQVKTTLDIAYIMVSKCDRWAERLMDAGRVKDQGCNPDYCELE